MKTLFFVGLMTDGMQWEERLLSWGIGEKER